MKNILNKILSEKNISVRKFSKLSDISRSEISRMKNNSKDNISIKTIGKASRALQIDPNIIFPLDNLSKPPIQKEYFNLNNLNYLKEHIDSKKLDFEIHTYKDELRKQNEFDCLKIKTKENSYLDYEFFGYFQLNNCKEYKLDIINFEIIGNFNKVSIDKIESIYENILDAIIKYAENLGVTLITVQNESHYLDYFMRKNDQQVLTPSIKLKYKIFYSRYFRISKSQNNICMIKRLFY